MTLPSSTENKLGTYICMVTTCMQSVRHANTSGPGRTALYFRYRLERCCWMAGFSVGKRSFALCFRSNRLLIYEVVRKYEMQASRDPPHARRGRAGRFCSKGTATLPGNGGIALAGSLLSQDGWASTIVLLSHHRLKTAIDGAVPSSRQLQHPGIGKVRGRMWRGWLVRGSCCSGLCWRGAGGEKWMA
jgi:hypothetical protein